MIDGISFIWGIFTGVMLFGLAGWITYSWAVKNMILVYHGR